MRDFESWSRSLQNFEWLHGCVPGATDFDFVVERRGRFLVCEFKPYADGVRMPFGQYLALAALSAIEEFDVYLVGQSERFPDRYYITRVGDRDPVISGPRRPVWYPPKRFIRSTQDSLRDLVREWFEEQAA